MLQTQERATRGHAGSDPSQDDLPHQAALLGSDIEPSPNLVLENALETDDVGDQQVALVFLGKMPAGENLHAGAGPRFLLIDLRRMGVAQGKRHVPREQGGVVRVGAGAIVDEVLAPAIPDVAVRVGKAGGHVDVELLRARLVAKDGAVRHALRRTVGRIAGR